MISRFGVLIRGLVTKTYLYGYVYNLCLGVLRVRPDTVMLESHHGVEFMGNPHAIATHLLSEARYGHLRLVIVENRKSGADLDGRFPGHRIVVVKRLSVRYCYYLAVSGLLVNDVTFPTFFRRRSEQRYLNTWHGTPLKAMGRHVANETMAHVSNPQRNLFHTTLLLAPNAHTEEILLDAYMLRGLRDLDIARCGYPRNDVLFRSRGHNLGKETLDVAFMPTWRGDFTTRKEASFKLLEELKSLLLHLEDHLPGHVTIWVRLHPLIQGKVSLQDFGRIKAFPKAIDPYTHLARCHALITDYSSVMFDFATTLRPIILYTPDADQYKLERNLYLDLEDLPFPRVRTHQQLVQKVLDVHVDPSTSSSPQGERYREFVDEFCSWDDGNNTARLCGEFFRQEGAVEVHRATATRKKKILIYTGALLNNGIVRSFKTLLPLIDRERFDVTVLADTSYGSSDANQYFSALQSDTRFIPLNLSVHISPIEAGKLLLAYLFRRQWAGDRSLFTRVWGRESARLFGEVQFDTFVNFNGYSWRAAFLLLGANCRTVIYVHNEMSKEVAARRVADHRLLRLSYEAADTVALVREGVENEYCDKVFDYRSKAIYTPNLLLEDVVARSERPLSEAFADGPEAGNFEQVARALADQDKHRFVNVARFSPEKGQLRLIEAFEQVWADHPESQLLIIGSHGVSLESIRARQKASPARDSVLIVVGSANPFPLVRHADTFVLSSTYEGIGLVLFEAMQLGLPIVSSDIPGPSELLAGGYGLVVENSVEGLATGMRKAIDGHLPNKPYDFQSHNSFALAQFHKCVERTAAH